MKHWIFALLVITLPLITYFILDNTMVDKKGFEAVAKVQYTKPMVVKFSSPMCLDCKKLEVTIKEVMPKYKDSVDYQSYTTQNKDKTTNSMIKKYGVTLVPTMIFVKKDGGIYKRTEGYLTEPELESIIKGLING